MKAKKDNTKIKITRRALIDLEKVLVAMQEQVSDRDIVCKLVEFGFVIEKKTEAIRKALNPKDKIL